MDINDVVNSVLNEVDTDNKIMRLNNNFSAHDLRDIGSDLIQNGLIGMYGNILIKRIGFSIITNKLYKNRLAFLKRGDFDYGATIQEIFVGIADPYQYQLTESPELLLKRYPPDIKEAFHSVNFKKFYPVTVEFEELKESFINAQAHQNLITKVIESIYSAANYDEYLMILYMLAKQILAGNIKTVNLPQKTNDNVGEISAIIQETTLDLADYSSDYTLAGNLTYSDPSGIYLLLKNGLLATRSMNLLAQAFNKSEATFLGQQINFKALNKLNMDRIKKIFENDPTYTFTPFTEDELEILQNVEAITIDKSYLFIYDRLKLRNDFTNSRELYTNYYYHVWNIYSTSPFHNAVAFVANEKAIVENVKVLPENAAYSRGKKVDLSLQFTGAGLMNKSIGSFSFVADNTHNLPTSKNTFIDFNGVLYIGNDETVSTDKKLGIQFNVNIENQGENYTSDISSITVI